MEENERLNFKGRTLQAYYNELHIETRQKICSGSALSMGTGCSNISTMSENGTFRNVEANDKEHGISESSETNVLTSKILQVDPAEHEIPLTQDERKLIMDLWIDVKTDLVRIGIKIFIR